MSFTEYDTAIFRSPWGRRIKAHYDARVTIRVSYGAPHCDALRDAPSSQRCSTLRRSKGVNHESHCKIYRLWVSGNRLSNWGQNEGESAL